MSAFLVLEDGTVHRGRPYGAHGVAVGEVVFTTSMTGYQEVVTDPSFAGQLVTFTQPMIGNYGVEADASESPAPAARAVIVREGRNSTPNGREGFSDWLAARGVVGLQGVDTRAITRRLRDGGSVRGGGLDRHLVDRGRARARAQRAGDARPGAGRPRSRAPRPRPCRRWRRSARTWRCSTTASRARSCASCARRARR